MDALLILQPRLGLDEFERASFFLVNILDARAPGDHVAGADIGMIGEALLAMHRTGLIDAHVGQYGEGLPGIHDQRVGECGWRRYGPETGLFRRFLIGINRIFLADGPGEVAYPSLLTLAREGGVFLADEIAFRDLLLPSPAKGA